MVTYNKKEFKSKAKKYISGRMEFEEMIIFENFLDKNPYQKDIVEGMVIDQNIFEGKPPRILTTPEYRFKQVSIAAAVILLITVGGYLSVSLLPVPDSNVIQDKLTDTPIFPFNKKVKVKRKKVNTQHKPVNAKAIVNPQKVTLKPKKEDIPNSDTLLQKLIAINKQEIKYWEDELDIVSSNRSSRVIEVVSITSKGSQTRFEFKYLGKEMDFRPVMTLYGIANMIKPIVEEIPLLDKGSKVFGRTLVLPVKSTYYWKVMNDEVIYMGKLVK